MHIQPLYNFEGIIAASPSKSYSHRAFFYALGAKSPSLIINPLSTGDVGVTIEFCKALGAKIDKYLPKPNEIVKGYSESDKIYQLIPPPELKNPNKILDGKNSGTSIRIMTALTPLIPGVTHISGVFFEKNRPIKPLLEALSVLDMSWEYSDGDPHVIIRSHNSYTADFKIPGDISSLFISGLLCMTPHLHSNQNILNSKVIVTTPVVSYPYLKITEDVMLKFGIKFKVESNSQSLITYTIPGDQTYKGQNIRIPGDFSSSAFIMAAAALNPFPNIVTITNLDCNSPQGDKEIIRILQKMNADLRIDNQSQSIAIKGGRFLDGIKIDCNDIPDLFPILCVLGLYSNFNTVLYNLKHIRTKESDRVVVMVRELRKMGAQIKKSEDSISIEGPQQLRGVEFNHESDHRIAMALTIAALYARSTSILNNPEIVNDSYPNFFKDLQTLGAIIN